jgi:hypothetical protein
MSDMMNNAKLNHWYSAAELGAMQVPAISGHRAANIAKKSGRFMQRRNSYGSGCEYCLRAQEARHDGR